MGKPPIAGGGHKRRPHEGARWAPFEAGNLPPHVHIANVCALARHRSRVWRRSLSRQRLRHERGRDHQATDQSEIAAAIHTPVASVVGSRVRRHGDNPCAGLIGPCPPWPHHGRIGDRSAIRVRGLIVKLRTGNPVATYDPISSATTSIADMIGRIDEVVGWPSLWTRLVRNGSPSTAWSRCSLLSAAGRPWSGPSCRGCSPGWRTGG